ncbi:hypothetical protein GUJ93_ZPchr0004g38423 [Zizania palustris]|uniref:Uncharacterized protein n=1 Tax=Zizania palustris TaxID=103762 RepID=A0A8J5RZ80_ZIZPA|nr:hypothetical protein GUJ93_ZPchr0004g38505 [Zizania palustris]KAG8064913.1 hypothetical protein GUJ93_ZPchr0004g38423 [Zizania palustris]
MLHELGCQHLKAAISIKPMIFDGPRLTLLAPEVIEAWHPLHQPKKAQTCKVALKLQKADCLRCMGQRTPPSGSNPPPPKV